MTTERLAMCALTCATLTLGGCAGLSGSGSSDLLKQLDVNFANCDRHLTFQAGTGVALPGAQFSGSIDCRGVSAAVPAIAAPPATGQR